MWKPPTRYPHRVGKCYTVMGFTKLLKNLAREQKFTPQQLRNLKALYFGTGFQKYLDDEGIYRRSNGLWRLGNMIAFKSPATWRLMGAQLSIETHLRSWIISNS